MTTQDVKRKLTAILSADVKGYHRLIEKDEAGTLQTLNIYKEVMTKVIRDHHGRVVDASGDNVLAEFASVVDAVECGVEIQRELRARNEKLPVHRKMDFRIGINFGDVIEEEDKIFGDGVNIAARMQNLADGGGLCISGTVYEHIKSKLTLQYEYLGKQKVKNIIGPVKAYRVMIEPETLGSAVSRWKRAGVNYWKRIHPAFKILVALVAAGNALWQIYPLFVSPPTGVTPKDKTIDVASKEKMVFPLPDKPSIAVLPFANMSGDPKKDYLSDGITEEIINALSKIPSVFVIARNSTFTYKGKPVKVQQVSEEMGVQYVMEGSVQWSGDRVRITVQLIDALKGHHLFSERYDRELKDIFTLQDDITMKALMAMRVALRGEDARASQKGTTKNLDAYLKLLQAWEHMNVMNKDKMALARPLVEEALALDPENALAYAALAHVTVLEVYVGASKSPRESLDRAEELAKKALALDDSNFYPHTVLSFTYRFKKQFDKAISEAEKAVALSPNSALACFTLGGALYSSERFEEAIPHLKKSLRLSPIPIGQCLHILATTYRFLGRYDEAIATYKKLLQREPDYLPAHVNLAATYVLAGRQEEARAEAAEVMRIDPQFSVERYTKTWPLRQALIDQSVEALHKAGLK
jgi:adenylate cyclase